MEGRMPQRVGTAVLLGSLVTFVAAELWYAYGPRPVAPPLTHLVVDHVPEPIGKAAAVGFALWVVVHFHGAYERGRKRRAVL